MSEAAKEAMQFHIEQVKASKANLEGWKVQRDMLNKRIAEAQQEIAVNEDVIIFIKTKYNIEEVHP